MARRRHIGWTEIVVNRIGATRETHHDIPKASSQTLTFLRRDSSDVTSVADHPSIAAPRTILVLPSNPRKVMGRFHKQLLEAV